MKNYMKKVTSQLKTTVKGKKGDMPMKKSEMKPIMKPKGKFDFKAMIAKKMGKKK